MVRVLSFLYNNDEVIPMDLIEYMVKNGADFDFAVLIAEQYQ